MTRLHLLYAILVSVVLLPWIKIGSGVPAIRPEWLLLLASLLVFHRIRARAIDSMVVFWSGAVGISFAVSMAYGVAFLNVAMDMTDLFELLKPLLYFLLYLFVASIVYLSPGSDAFFVLPSSSYRRWVSCRLFSISRPSLSARF